MRLPAAYIPDTFAHLPVWDLLKDGLPRGLVQAVVGVDLRVSDDDMKLSVAEYHDRVLRPAEVCLLDAIGLRTFSTFVCVSFRHEGDVCRIDAWQAVAVASNKQAA